jgi:hypothetical protein
VTYCEEKRDSDLGRLFVDVSASHVTRHVHPVGLLLTSDQPEAETVTYTIHKQH